MAEIPLPLQGLRHLEPLVPNAPKPGGTAVLDVNNFVSNVLIAQGQLVLYNDTESPQVFLDSTCAPPVGLQSHIKLYGVTNMCLVSEDDEICEVYDLDLMDDMSSMINTPYDFLNVIDSYKPCTTLVSNDNKVIFF